MKLMKKICFNLFIGLIAVMFASSSAHAAFDRKIKNSSNDATAGYLCGDKLVSGSNVTVVEGSDGGDETCTISASVTGSGVTLDLADDASNESTGINEIATTNDPDSIVTEPSADKVLFDFAPVILETELDSETELETQLSDVTDVFTNNDGALNDDNLTDNNITDLSDGNISGASDGQILLYDGVTDNAWENKTMSGDCTISAAGAISCTGLGEWNDAGLYLEPKTDGDGIEISDSGGTKGIRIYHDGTQVIFDVQGTTPLYRFSDLANCDTIDSDANGNLTCGTDATTGLGTAEVLDLGDDGSNESADISEIATTNDTNNIVTEPTADKMLIDMAQNWPTSDTADALSTNGANCSAGNYPLGVDATGAVEGCTADDDVPEVGDFDAFVGGSHTTYDTANDDLDLDTEVVTHQFSLGIFDPTTADTNKIQHKAATAITITKVSCSTDTGTATINLDERVESTPNTSGTDVLSAGLVCDNNSQTSCSSGCDVNTISNGGIDIDDPINLQISATASTPTALRVHVEYTIDDV